MKHNSSPNVFVIVSDHHHRRMAGDLDHPHVKTPALDSLAADGAVFTNAYCNNPVSLLDMYRTVPAVFKRA